MGLSIEGKDEGVRRLRDVAERARDLRPAWPRVGSIVADSAERDFETGGAASGKPWPALSPDYRRRKVREGGDPDAMVRSGRLRRGLTSRPMDFELYRPDSAEFGSDVDYGHWHQRGSRRLPRRRMLQLDPATREQIRDEIADWIVRGNDRVE